MRRTKKIILSQGSVTVEAAIALPAFICAVLAIAFIMKIIYVHEIIQHAITETADEIASYTYIYSAAGLQSLHDTANEGLEEGKQKVGTQIKTLLNTYDCFTSFPENANDNLGKAAENINVINIGGAIDDFNEINQSAENIINSLEDTRKIADEIAANPKKELKYIATALAKEGFEGVKAELILKPLTKACLMKYLRPADGEDISVRLKKLNIVDGFNGLNFKDSHLLDDGKNIEIRVEYKIKAPLPFNILPDIPIVQRVKVKAWLDGEIEDKEDIWSLGDLERGRKIQKMYGRNLPDNFKTITKFEYGTATLVRSINLNANTYQKKPRRVFSEVKKAIKDLRSFEKDHKTIDENGRTIEYYVEADDIKYRRVIIVIPKGSRNAEFDKIFEECMKNAEQNDVELTIDEL